MGERQVKAWKTLTRQQPMATAQRFRCTIDRRQTENCTMIRSIKAWTPIPCEHGRGWSRISTGITHASG
uniref:Transposase n=1 Tax=Ascaris lumbricoides TaxID=6252 RepID=A0A0M3IAB3_ASCLU